ncbi:ubiquinol-cytochrome C chaperone family protein [Notoacmeibacter sp. MSK16QG-6]|uniref:ubiquinol-cytochrome C chaperone family protein n=1 Tax=Notoacmeibacter sp. MSK16QG-6 TaxID=2957982 RepID=UPI00209E4E51|nr:ubiquinol-cytochrome C chaperone family protein [Notoacmeibacter sp. MSK16QG-6]MCP1198451.1 ubiquinol-cytochrome C chaperone [Notoacmeibacter sp. MSK16QG-6]
MQGLYGAIVAAGRDAGLYQSAHVPDTPLGRFEMLALHVALVVRRLRIEDDNACQELAQELTDRLFTDIDHAQRELGIGDLGMRHRMKAMGKMYYGRLDAYGAALDKGDGSGLASALRRNALAGAMDADAQPLAIYAATMAKTLDQSEAATLLDGSFRFPSAATVLAAISDTTPRVEE